MSDFGWETEAIEEHEPQRRGGLLDFLRGRWPSVAGEPLDEFFDLDVSEEAIELAEQTGGGRKVLQEAAGDVYLGQLMGIPPEDAAALLEPIRKDDPHWAQGLREVEASWHAGWIDLNLGLLMYERLLSTLQLGSKDPTKRTAAETRVLEIDRQAAELETRRPQIDPKKQGLFWRGLSSASRMAPIMLKGMEAGGKLGLATGGALAGMTAVLGQTPPLTGAPEEAITVPSMFVMGFGVGATTGSAQHIMKVEAGLAMVEMLREGIDENVAAAASLGVGVINSLLEVAQIGDIVKSIPGFDQILRKAIRQSSKTVIKSGILRGLARGVMQAGKHTAVETLQELAQESTNIAATELGKVLTNMLQEPVRTPAGGWTKLEPTTVQDVVDRLTQTAIDSALGFGVIQAPGAVARTAAGVGKPAAGAAAQEGVPRQGREAAPEAGDAIAHARTLLSRPEELTAQRASEAAAQVDAVLQSPDAAPDDLVQASEIADMLDTEIAILPGVRAQTPEEAREALRVIAGGEAVRSVLDIQETAGEPRPLQPSGETEEIYRLAEQARPELEAILTDVTEGIEADIHLREGFKKPERVEKKVPQTQGGAAGVLDYDAATIAVQNRNDIPALVHKLGQKGKVVRIKNFFRRVPTTGYKSVLVNVQMPNGVVDEIQVTDRAVYKAKTELGHKLYRVYRDVIEAVEAGKLQRSPEVETFARLLIEASEAVYALAEPDLAKANASSLLSLALKDLNKIWAASKSVGVGSILSDKTRNTLPELSSIAKGISSYSMNIRSESSGISAPSTRSIAQEGAAVKAEGPPKVRRTIAGQTYEFEQPPRAFGSLALRLRDGRIVSDPDAQLWVDIAQKRGIEYSEIADTGRVVGGTYLTEEEFAEVLAAPIEEEQERSARQEAARRLGGPLAEGEAARILDTIVGAAETGADLGGKGLNLAEIRSLSQFKTKGVSRAKAETALERGGILPAGPELRRGGKATQYLMAQIEKNPLRWRAIENRFSLHAMEQLGRLGREDIAEYQFVEDVAAALAGSKEVPADIVELVADLRAEVVSAEEAGIHNAEDFAREMKATEVPGQEQPAEVYRKAWNAAPRLSQDERAQRFLDGLSRTAVEMQIRDAVQNPNVPADVLKLFAPIYNRIHEEKGLSKAAYGELLRKMAAQPHRWKDAFDRALSDETAPFEFSRRYEAGLSARLPKHPGAGLEKYRDLTVNRIVEDKENAELTPVRKRIQQIIRGAYKPPSGAVNYEEAVRIRELQASVDNRPGSRLVKTQERLRHYYETHPEQPSESIQKFLAKRFIGVMTYGELEAFDKEIRDLRQVGRTKRTLALLQEKKIVAKAQEHIKREILGKEVFETTRGKGSITAEEQMRGKPKRFVQAYSLNMLRLARMLGPTTEKWLTREVNKTLDEELRSVDAIVEPAKAKMKELGIGPRELAKELSTKDGLRFTVDQVIHMYVAMKNEDERATLIHGNKIRAEEVADLTGQLTDAQRAWGDYMLSVFSEENFDRLNKAYIEDRNQASVRVEHYFPIRAREGTYEAINQEIQSDLTTRAGARRGYPAKGFLIERMQIADEHRRPMRLGATAIFFEQIEKQEHYITHWRLAKRLQNIFTRDKNLVETIARTFGRDFNKALSTYINEVANPGAFRVNELRAPLMDALRHNVTLGALALNINALLNNLTGPMMYLADAGPLHMLSATAQWVAHPKHLYDFVTERDPQVKHVSIDPILEEIRRRYPNQFATFKSTLTKIGMAPLEAIDMWTRLVGWKAVYDKAMAAQMSEEEAVRLAQEATLRTQPSGRLKDLPLMYQDRAAQMFLMFTRQINQIWNMYTADMPMDLKRGKIMHVLGDALALALTGIAIGTIGRKRLPEDPLEWALDVAGQFITSIPFVGNDVLTGLQGYWWSGRGVNLWGFASTLGQQVGKRIKKGGDLQDWADSFLIMAPELMKLLGLPGAITQRAIRLIQTSDPWELVGGRK